jgi:hypothetical protein
MADTAKYKSLSVAITTWKELGIQAERTNRTRSKMVDKLLKFYKENRGESKLSKKIENKITCEYLLRSHDLTYFNF